MNFSEALHCVNAGYRIARSGWNGKGMWLFRVNDWDCTGCEKSSLLPFIAMKTADDKIVPWLASQTDILARDWVELD